MAARVLTINLSIAFLLAWGGCEKTNHDNIDKWMNTSKGPAKLAKALADESLAPDLSAHAGANLVKKQKEAEVRAALEAMSPARRTQVIGELAPKLWDMARVEDPLQLPNSDQIAAKDAIVTLRKWVEGDPRTKIDNYLIDWYAVASYEARARTGANQGATVMRLIGPAAAKKLIGVVNGVIAAPGQEQEKIKIHDELLLGLAVTGSPEAVKHVLDIAKLDRADRTLATRATSALYAAYVDSRSLVDLVPPEPLVPNLPAIVELVKDTKQPGAVVNNAIALIRAVGGARCVDELVPLIPLPHSEAKFKYVAATFALRCGGPQSITRVFHALPDPGSYEQAELPGTILQEISKMAAKDQVQAALRPLLDDKSTVVKWLAVEALGAIASAEDAPRIAALSAKKERLTGYWGETGKPDPTLGERAKEVAGLLARK